MVLRRKVLILGGWDHCLLLIHDGILKVKLQTQEKVRIPIFSDHVQVLLDDKHYLI